MHRLLEEVQMSSGEDHNAQPGRREARPGGLSRTSWGSSTTTRAGQGCPQLASERGCAASRQQRKGWSRGAGGDSGQGRTGLPRQRNESGGGAASLRDRAVVGMFLSFGTQ